MEGRPTSEQEPEFLGDAENHWVLQQRVHPTVRRISESLGLPEEVERTANKLLMWYKSVKKRRATSSLGLASIVLASRMYGITIPLRSVPEVSPRSLMRALGELGSVVRKVDTWDPYLNYVVGNLVSALSLEPKHLVRERLWIRAKKEVLRILRERREEVLGKNPLGIVALATYIAAKKCGLNSVSLETVAKCSGVHRSTLYRISRRIEGER